MTIDIAALGCLLNGDGEVLSRMVNADHRYRAAVMVVERRNEVHRVLQERSELLSARFGESAPLDALRAWAPAMVAQLHDLTDAMYSEVEAALAANADADARARHYAVENFKGERFYTVEELPIAP